MNTMTALLSTANDSNHTSVIPITEKIEYTYGALASLDGQSVSMSYDFELDELEDEIDADISISSSSDDDESGERFIPFRLNDIDFPSSSSKSQRRKQEQEGGGKKKPRRVSKSRLRELQDAVERDTEKLQQKKIENLRRQQHEGQPKGTRTTIPTKRNVQLLQEEHISGRDGVTSPGKQSKLAGTPRRSSIMSSHSLPGNKTYRRIRQQT